MDLISIGSMGNYIKNLGMEQKWNMKKRSGDFSSDGTKTVSEWVEAQKKKIEDRNDDPAGADSRNDSMLKNIHNKMSVGQRLTPSERQYLQKKDPQTYKKLRDIEAEQEKYEQDLKRCKTKEEVQKLKMTHVSQSLSTVNTVKNNPYIPEGKKLEIIMGEQQKMKAIETSTDEFVKSGRYSALPSEAEKAEAEKILKEAKEEKLHPENEENEREDSAIRDDITVKTDDFAAEADTEKVKDAGEKTSTGNEALSAEKTIRAYEKARTVSVRKKRSSSINKSSAKAKEVTSPAVRKVKRAKNAYTDTVNKTAQAAGVPLASAKASFETKA